MKSVKKTMACVVGGMVIAGTAAYLAMPTETKMMMKDMMMGMMHKKTYCPICGNDF